MKINPLVKSITFILIIVLSSCATKNKIVVVQSNLICSGCIVQINSILSKLNQKKVHIYIHNPNSSSFQKEKTKRKICSNLEFKAKIHFNNFKYIDSLNLKKSNQIYLLYFKENKKHIINQNEIDSFYKSL